MRTRMYGSSKPPPTALRDVHMSICMHAAVYVLMRNIERAMAKTTIAQVA